MKITAGKLPELIEGFNLQLSMAQKGEIKASLYNVEVAYSAINQLIHYISALERRVAALEPDNRKQIEDM